jgi:hypothetical protein
MCAYMKRSNCCRVQSSVRVDYIVVLCGKKKPSRECETCIYTGSCPDTNEDVVTLKVSSRNRTKKKKPNRFNSVFGQIVCARENAQENQILNSAESKLCVDE